MFAVVKQRDMYRMLLAQSTPLPAETTQQTPGSKVTSLTTPAKGVESVVMVSSPSTQIDSEATQTFPSLSIFTLSYYIPSLLLCSSLLTSPYPPTTPLPLVTSSLLSLHPLSFFITSTSAPLCHIQPPPSLPPPLPPFPPSPLIHLSPLLILSPFSPLSFPPSLPLTCNGEWREGYLYTCNTLSFSLFQIVQNNLERSESSWQQD